MRALVTGSTGYIGSRLVPALLAAGWQVLAGARSPDKLDNFDTTTPQPSSRDGSAARLQGGAIPVSLDVLDAESCRAALTDHGPVDVAYYLVHGIGEGDFETTDLKAAQTFAAAAARAGVRRVVYLGGLVPAGEDLSEHLRSRRAVAQALAAPSDEEPDGGADQRSCADTATGPDLVWLRAAIILGAGSTSYELIRHLVDRLPLIPTPTWMRHRVQPIAVDDVLHYLLAAAEEALPAGGYDIGGLRALPYRDLVALQAQVTGKRRLLVPVPLVSTEVASRVIAAVVPLPRELVVDLVDSLNNTMVVQDDQIRQLVPDPPGGLTGLSEALRRCAASPEDEDEDEDEDVHGAGATSDPLHRTTTDPDWAA